MFSLLFLECNIVTSGSVTTHAQPFTVITACQGNHSNAVADTSFLPERRALQIWPQAWRTGANRKIVSKSRDAQLFVYDAVLFSLQRLTKIQIILHWFNLKRPFWTLFKTTTQSIAMRQTGWETTSLTFSLHVCKHQQHRFR